MNDPNRLLKWVLMAVMVAFSIAVIYPPSERLKGGIDLVGGTSLLFELDTRDLEAGEIRGLAGRVTEVLKERVDPGGRYNIEWRPIGNTRLEIRMPLPPATAIERRKIKDAKLDEIQAHNLTRFEIEQALSASGDRREELLAGLIRGVEPREPIIEKLVQVWDELAAGTEEEVSLREEFEEALHELLMTNLPTTRLNDVMALTNDTTRQEEMEALKAAYPSYAAQIDEYRKTFDDWSRYKAELEDASDLKRRLKGAGVLEFRILAERDPSSPDRINAYGDAALQNQRISRYVDQLTRQGPRPQPGDLFQWFEIRDILDFMDIASLSEFETAKNLRSYIVERYAGRYYVLAHDDDAHAMVASKGGGQRWKLRQAFPTRDPMSGRNIVSFSLDPRGGQLFGRLTETNIDRLLCIFLDGQAVSAANIRDRITTQGTISGNFSLEDAVDLSRTLEAGALPARVKETPLREVTIGSSLGDTNRSKGLYACQIALAIVALFILVYYGFIAGGVADIALALNILFVLAVMAVTESTFTLPGIAGLILTVGMAVDANVLIFERVREERDRGVVFRKALNAGYDKALSTILDANLTTLITCVILGALGSEEVKGFAVTLGVGVATSMFTALFFTRLVFNTLIAKGMLTDFSMRRILHSVSIDWLSKRTLFWPLSSIAVALMLTTFLFLGSTDPERVFDIEFLGGTSVQVDLKEGVQMTDQEVRQAVAGKGEDSAANWLRQAADELPQVSIAAGMQPSQFRITSETLTGVQLDALLHAEVEPHLERDGTNIEGRTVIYDTRPGVVSRSTLETIIADSAAAARKAAENLSHARVQSVMANPGEPPSSFEVVTVETNRGVVQSAMLAVLSDKLDVQQPLTFTIRHDDEITMAPYFVIETDDEYLSDVVEGAPQYSIREFKGGVAIDVQLDSQEAPITTDEFERRLREIGLQPEFEDYQQRRFSIFGVDAVQNGESDAYRRLVVVSSDDMLRYDDDPARWTESVAEVQVAQVEAALGTERSLSKVVQFAPQIAEQVAQQAYFAVFVALAAIVAYVWLRFGTMQFGLAAIVALAHDVTITLGLIAIFGFKIDLAMVAAVLTVIGYSLNDTIVVFDRIRENRGRIGNLSPAIINNSINQTLSRTILTSGTTILVVVLLLLFGGEGVAGFAFALTVGVLVGTYSSIAIASPLLSRPKVLSFVVLLLAALGTIGAIFEITDDSTARIIMGGVAVVVFGLWIYRNQTTTYGAGQPA